MKLCEHDMAVQHHLGYGLPRDIADFRQVGQWAVQSRSIGSTKFAAAVRKPPACTTNPLKQSLIGICGDIDTMNNVIVHDGDREVTDR